MKNLIVSTLILCIVQIGFGQKYWTQTGHIEFFSEAPMENIEADNNQVSGIIDSESGEMAFSLLMKAFMFEKALMQEHFNEKYVQTEKYPKAQFKGKITNLADVDFSTPGEYEAIVDGELTMHGETNPVSSKGTIVVNANNTIDANAEFMLNIKAYKIQIPAVVKDNIAEDVKITVEMNYELYNK